MEPQEKQEVEAANPYGRPQSPLAGPQAERTSWLWLRIVYRMLSIVIALYCVGQCVLTWVVVLRYLKMFGAAAVPVSFIAESLLAPVTLALAGLFLAFGKRLSVVLFLAYLCQRAVVAGVGDVFGVVPIGVPLAFLAYSGLLWFGGALTGWPARRAPPATRAS